MGTLMTTHIQTNKIIKPGQPQGIAPTVGEIAGMIKPVLWLPRYPVGTHTNKARTTEVYLYFIMCSFLLLLVQRQLLQHQNLLCSQTKTTANQKNIPKMTIAYGHIIKQMGK